MELKHNIKILKISYICQIILLIDIIVLNVFYKNSKDWMSEVLSILFYIAFYGLIIITVFVFTFFIVIFFKNSYKILFRILRISIILFVVRLIITVGLFIIYIINNIDYISFYEYCPFNYDQSDLTSIFPNLGNIDITTNNDIKNECSIRRCIEYNSNTDENKYPFICNFNSKNLFDESENIICEKIYSNNIDPYIEEIMISYINLCKPYRDMYKCTLSHKPKQFHIKADYICPENKKNSIILEVTITILNTLFPIVIFFIQFIYYKDTLKLIVTREIQRGNDLNKNKTIDTSNKVSNKSDKSFKKEKTEVIIVDGNSDNNRENNLIQIIQKNEDKDTYRKKYIKIFKNDFLHKKKKIKILEKEIIRHKKNIGNKSFTKNKNDINDDNTNVTNTIRLLTEVNKIKKSEEEKNKEQDNAKCIIIKK